jgi:hypothetical protein
METVRAASPRMQLSAEESGTWLTIFHPCPKITRRGLFPANNLVTEVWVPEGRQENV